LTEKDREREPKLTPHIGKSKGFRLLQQQKSLAMLMQ